MDNVTFSNEFLQKVKEMNDIIDVASEYFDLKQVGDLYRAKCKHKGDNTPSLTFFPDTQSFYCFGCHAGKRNSNTNGSDVISFIQWVEEISWQEAVIFLANRVGLEIPTKELTEEDKQKLVLYELTLRENRKYWLNLMSNEKVKQYFYNRGIDDEDIAKWRLGADKDIPVYAIIDEYGRTISFAKRIDSEDAKYINSKNSPIFKKSNILYGLNFIKKDMRKLNFIVIVEGYNDAILLQKYGVPAAAIMSTTITENQIKLIKKYTNNVVLFLDGDTAGINNTISNIKQLKKEGLEVEVINVLGFDPDEVAIKHKDKLLDFILEHKQLAYQFLINNVLGKYFNSLIKMKKEVVKQLEEILNYIEDDIEKKLYKDQLLKIVSLEEYKNL